MSVIVTTTTPATDVPPSPGPDVVVIRPPSGWAPLDLRELWAYRELLYFLVWRDIKVRYKQTVVGVAWAVIQPVFTMIVFSIFLGGLAKMPSDGLPYPVFVYTALLPWQLFAHALTDAGNSLVGNQNLITKVYFPRLLVPFASVLTGLADFFVAFGVLVVLMFFYGVMPSPGVVFLPLLLVLAVATGIGVGLWLSALNVQYRDVRYTIPFLVQLWLYATPVAYPSSLVPEAWRPLMGLNPMAGVVEGFRWALLGSGASPGPVLLVSGLVVTLLVVSGMYYFRRMERTFADVI